MDLRDFSRVRWQVVGCAGLASKNSGTSSAANGADKPACHLHVGSQALAHRRDHMEVLIQTRWSIFLPESVQAMQRFAHMS